MPLGCEWISNQEVTQKRLISILFSTQILHVWAYTSLCVMYGIYCSYNNIAKISILDRNAIFNFAGNFHTNRSMSHQGHQVPSFVEIDPLVAVRRFLNEFYHIRGMVAILVM